ncbi:MAG: 30S ribosomal protein S16 [Acidobacteria bacterium]|nr:30S ribosomal protein S16 [Acidobacteriota bacterium]
MVRIRLRRMGAKKRPFYRMVVSDSRRRPTGKVLDSLGEYEPGRKPVHLKVDLERVDAWIRKGAQASETVRRLIQRARTVSSA